MKNVTEPCGCKIADYGGQDICTWMCQIHFKEKIEMLELR